MTTTQERVEKMPRQMIIDALRTRDGNICQYPGCAEKLDFSVTEGPKEVTIDHWYPQYWCKENGWTYEETWALSNLKLAHKACNAKKGDRIPNDDGTLPEKVTRTFRYRRQKRATRAGLCNVCDNGHNLFVGEVCASCGGNAQAFPRWAKVRYQDCEHEISWCWACSIGVVERPAAVDIAVRQAESGEWDEN